MLFERLGDLGRRIVFARLDAEVEDEAQSGHSREGIGEFAGAGVSLRRQIEGPRHVRPGGDACPRDVQANGGVRRVRQGCFRVVDRLRGLGAVTLGGENISDTIFFAAARPSR